MIPGFPTCQDRDQGLGAASSRPTRRTSSSKRTATQIVRAGGGVPKKNRFGAIPRGGRRRWKRWEARRRRRTECSPPSDRGSGSRSSKTRSVGSGGNRRSVPRERDVAVADEVERPFGRGHGAGAGQPERTGREQHHG